jgi:hypothetical protein
VGVFGRREACGCSPEGPGSFLEEPPVKTPGGPTDVRQRLLARLRKPQPEDTTLPAEADRYLHLNPDDAEVREAREMLPELDQSE